MLTLPPNVTQTGATACLAALTAALGQQGSQVVVDASALRQFDSTALAVLLALQRQAHALGKNLTLQDLPPRLTDLARLYGVAELLGIVPAGSAEAAG